jgi:hypothetical protein
MRFDLYGIDPWAGTSPRWRDWLAAGLGALLLLAGGLALWQSTGSSAAVAARDNVDTAAWQSTVDRSQRLNRVLADVSRPWSRWLERSLALAGPDVRLERLDGEPATGRLEIVITAAALEQAGAFADALRALPGASGTQIARHEATTDGVRVHVEVTLK